MKAKIISKAAKITVSLAFSAGCVFKWLGVMPNATIGELAIAAVTAYGIAAGTIDINLMLEKFKT